MTNRNTTRWRRALRGGVIVSVSVALLVVITRAQRPHWRTFTFPADPKTGIAVAIDYPDDWRIGTMIKPAERFGPGMRVEFTPLSPVGLTRWWMEKVLRQDTNYKDGDNIQASVISGAEYKDMATMEKEMRGFFGPGCTLKMVHAPHALGPMLTASLSMTPQFLGRAGNQPGDRGYGAVIYPQTKSGLDKIYITAGALVSSPRYLRFNAALNAMIPRIRLVKR